ncbi:MAG: aldehyde dehydrogenase family protein [Alcaligenaceae bacterium]|nr:aldehyde dehydrogenase family protein [Alcaligenaceae bacterium]
MYQPRMLINGQWVVGGSDVELPVLNKFSGETIARIREATAEQVQQAVDAAQAAFEGEELSLHRRFQILEKASRLVQEDAQALAQMLVREVGKTIRESRAEVNSAAAALLNAAEEAKRIDGETIPVEANPGSERRFAVVMHTPSGPVCAITPFNAPLNQAAHKVAAAIAAGSPVVLKPSEQTPITAYRLAEILVEAGLPAGHLAVVFGRGPSVGEQLLKDPRFSRYTFTGSARTGRHILETVGIRPVALELGSNAPTIVFPDADLEQAALAARASGYAIAGQVCTSVQRLYVHESVIDRFTEIFVDKVGRLKVGDPMDDATDVGPVLTDAAAERAERLLSEAVQNGAKVLIGGKREGRMFQPTVLGNVRRPMAVVCQEVFAPIVNIMPFKDTDEVIREANDSEFGLQAGIFTKDIKNAFYVAKRLRYGGVMINDASRYRAPNQPYGGVKDSGIGREGPKYAIRELTDFKTVVFNLE